MSDFEPKSSTRQNGPSSYFRDKLTRTGSAEVSSSNLDSSIKAGNELIEIGLKNGTSILKSSLSKLQLPNSATKKKIAEELDNAISNGTISAHKDAINSCADGVMTKKVFRFDPKYPVLKQSTIQLNYNKGLKVVPTKYDKANPYTLEESREIGNMFINKRIETLNKERTIAENACEEKMIKRVAKEKGSNIWDFLSKFF